MKVQVLNPKCLMLLFVTVLLTYGAQGISYGQVCEAGDILAPGESCTYPGTDAEFTVHNNGNGQFLFFTSGTVLNIVDSTINGVSYTLVANKLASGSWEIEEIADSTAPATTNTAPTFTEGANTTRTIAENTSGDVNIGAAVAATDPENDTLTYTLSGTDAASFNIESITGQLKTSTALDYETKSTYTVTITVSDSNRTDTITVTINVSDIAETSTATTAVDIPDSNLRAKIETALGKTAGDPISAAEMATLTSLSAGDAGISNLTGLEAATNLTTLHLGNNLISDISAIAGLTKLTELQFWDNTISNISAVAGLTQLTRLYLWGNIITDISHISGLTNLTHLRLGENSVSNISAVAGLTNLTHLNLKENSISNISAVAGLTNLTELVIGNNTISDIAPVVNLTKLVWLDMPNNTISDITPVTGLTNLIELYFEENSVSDISPLTVNTGLGNNTEVDVRGNPLNYSSIYTHIPALQARGAYVDFDNRVATAPVKISGDTQQGSSGTTLAQPFVVEVRDGDSAAFARVPVTFAVTAGGGILSVMSTTTDANGRAASTLTLGNTAATNTVRVSVQGISQAAIFTAMATTTNTAPTFTDGASTTRSAAENTATGVNIGNAIAATDANNDTLTYTLGGTDAASFAIDSATGQLKTSAALDYETKPTYTVTITVSDGSLTDTITVTITVTDVNDTAVVSTLTPVCDRTPQVRDAIVAAVPGVSDCNDVTEVHLAVITGLDLENKNISSLKDGDFDGMTVLFELRLQNNRLQTLPANIFSGLSSLSVIYLNNNQLTNLPPTVFTGLTSLTNLYMNVNRLVTLPQNVFTGLSSLRQTNMHTNLLTTLPANVFSGLSSLNQISLNNNRISSLPQNVFSGRTRLAYLYLDSNRLTILPADLFSGLTALDQLKLNNNRLTSLPAGTFRGLTGLTWLLVQGNTVDPLPITILLEKVSTNEFKATAPVGAPFAMTIPITVVNGSISGGATTLTIPAGGVESQAHTVIRTPGTTAAVTLDIGTLPGLPTNHQGYQLRKSPNLPLTFFEASSNNAPVFTEGTTATRAVAENTASGVNIGNPVSATDADNDTLTYTLGGTDAALFSIVGSSGQLQTHASLDYETKSTYTVTITVSDGSLTDTITVTISVTDINELPTNTGICQVGDILAPGESCTYPGTDATFSVLDNGSSQWNIPDLPALLEWINQVSIGVSMSISTTINDQAYHFVAEEVSNDSWEIKEIGDSGTQQPDPPEPPDQSETESVTPTLSVSTASPLTEATLHESVLTFILSGGTYERSSFSIRNTITVSGIGGVAVGTFGVDRVSDTEATVELEFNGNIITDSTLTFTVGSGAIADYDGAALTAQIPVTAGTESLVASTAAPLTEATLNESVVTLTLSGRTYESSIFAIRDAVTVSGIAGVTVGTFDVDRASDTQVTVELTFSGDFDTDAMLTFTVEAGAIAGYSGPALTTQVSVTAGTESLTASTAAPLTEATLDESVVTLTLRGKTYEQSRFTIRNAITISGISGVTIGTFGVDRVSDTEITVELTFNGNINTDSTLTFILASSAITNYDGAAFTVQIPVTAGTESLVASTEAPLTEATLDESVVTLTLSGRTYEQSSFSVRDAITISGIDGVSVGIFDVDRASDTQVTVELTFSGDFDTDATLTVTVEAGAIAGYDGSAFTAQIPVTAGMESLAASTAAPLTESTLDESVVMLTLSGGTYERSSFRIRDAITVSGIAGVTVGTFGVDRVSDTEITIELTFDGNFQTDTHLTFTVDADAIADYNGPALTAEVPVTAGLEADANNDGVVSIDDLVLVASNYGGTGQNAADVNGDGVVDIDDLTTVTSALDSAAAAPLARPQVLEMFTAADVKLWLSHAQGLDLTDARVLRGILFLEQLLAALIPKESTLLPNYPNPFNPETWIPYRLAEDTFVTLTIYDGSGQVVRTLNVGHRVAAFYESRSKAIYWNGRNEFGEQVASGVYFYHLSAGDFSATRKMLIIK